MRNCDAHITGEMENRSRGELRDWSILVPILPGALLQNASDSNPEGVSRPPVITIKPDSGLNRESESEIRKCNGPDWARTSDPALIKRML